MVTINTLTRDTRAISDGDWFDSLDFLNVRIKTRGYTDDYIDALNKRTRRAAELHRCTTDTLPQNVMRSINAELVGKHLLLDVDGLTEEDGVTKIDVDKFRSLLARPEYNRLLALCFEAAAAITLKADAQRADAVGN
ncbi:hypothetical protein CGLAMM_07265 [Acetobacteraceae bacterium EV16G]|uniref:Uncharacterized protein n=1 Tax=Sorlinia euscelidii TaxID=3081148 RepID=A0ABU7U1V3_9PROT